MATLDWKTSAQLMTLIGYIRGGAEAVKKNKNKILDCLTKIKRRKKHIPEDLYEEVVRIEGMFENGTSYSIIFPTLACFVDIYYRA